ncbi:MAG: methyl-coenzyme M reductase operon protein D [Candidatus Methanoperedens sp.]|nr:methyl-coenzyme M reductase operon protein D [Candidatus Methanoperedens sp.]MCE8426381.1 methyl-coenzyme M reductase operon protein D [Candidatus Methanoperedens sp.]MCE8428920.1 methyl-coenzyme M reductase operon protein D [Candidatus Methanoperedens sp.]
MRKVVTTDSKTVQIKIFPQRLLQPDTAEKVLNEIDKVKGVIRMVLGGKNLPRKVMCGPGTGADVNHPDRQIINVGGQAFELQIIVGDIIVEVEDESNLDDLRKACECGLPFPFEFKRGFFLKKKATLSDYGKYGFKSRTDERINLDDDRLLGLMDPHAKAEDKLCIIGTEQEK